MTEQEERYSNRQIERLLDEQSKDIKEHIDAKTSPILVQTQKTNGRVNRAEDDIVNYKVWRGWMTGGMSVIMVVQPIVVAVLAWMALQIIDIPHQIQTSISDWAQTNVIKITQ